MELAQEILSRLESEDELSADEVKSLFSEIEEALESCTKQDLELPKDILLEKVLAEALQASSSQAVKLFEHTLKSASFEKAEELIKALEKVAPCDSGEYYVNLAKISVRHIKILPITRPSLAPDLLVNDRWEPRQRLVIDDYVSEERRHVKAVEYKASEFEIRRKEALYEYLQGNNGIGFYSALLSETLSETVSNFFGFAELEAEGKVYLREVCAEEAKEYDEGNILQQLRIFTGEITEEMLQERKGYVDCYNITEKSMQELRDKYEIKQEGFAYLE